MSEANIIVGGGQTAHCAAMAMRKSGFAGPIVIVGDEPLRPYERPPLSKAVLTGSEPPMPWLGQQARYRESGVDFMLGVGVVAIEPDARFVHLADGRRLGYRQLLLAPGGRARRLDVPGGEHIHYLRSHADALLLREALGRARRLVCIGAGVIGLEIASSARALGLAVTVVEAAPTVLGRCLAPGESAFMAALHREHGVELRLSAKLEAVEVCAGGKRVLLGDGSVIEADCVVAGIGMVRNTGLAQAAGLAVDNGIVVDEFGRTSAPDIFAAGDVSAFFHPVYGRRLRLESFYHAQDHGTAIGRVMAGGDEPYRAVPRFWTDQHGVNLQVLGMPLEAVRTVVRGSRESRRFTGLHLDAGGRVVGVSIADSPREMRPALELIRRGACPDEHALADARIPLNQLAA